MADKLTPEQRHRCMSRVRGKDTSIELEVRKRLFAHGYRYRLNSKKLPGHPDLVLAKYRTVIFVNGCFWHSHPGCKKAVIPATNRDFWENKIQSNTKRDVENYQKLENLGWRVIVVWECELSKKQIEETFSRIILLLNRPSINPESPLIAPGS